MPASAGFLSRTRTVHGPQARGLWLGVWGGGGRLSSQQLQFSSSANVDSVWAASRVGAVKTTY